MLAKPLAMPRTHKMLLKNEKEIKSEISEKPLKPIDITRTKFSRIDMFHLMVGEIIGFLDIFLSMLEGS